MDGSMVVFVNCGRDEFRPIGLWSYSFSQRQRGRGPQKKNWPPWARLWPGFFLMYHSLCAPLKLWLPYLLDSGASTGFSAWKLWMCSNTQYTAVNMSGKFTTRLELEDGL